MLGLHYPSDVAAGAALGVLLGAGVVRRGSAVRRSRWASTSEARTARDGWDDDEDDDEPDDEDDD